MLDAEKGILSVDAEGFSAREPAHDDLSQYHAGCGRELFTGFRQQVSAAADGACVLFPSIDPINDSSL